MAVECSIFGLLLVFSTTDVVVPRGDLNKKSVCCLRIRNSIENNIDLQFVVEFPPVDSFFPAFDLSFRPVECFFPPVKLAFPAVKLGSSGLLFVVLSVDVCFELA